MENARVFLLETYKGTMKMAIAVIKSKGHQVVLTANDYPQAQEACELLLDKKVNVAVIDSSRKYSQEIANLVKSVDSDIKIVAFGFYQEPEWGDNIPDAWVDKQINPIDLGKVITEI